MQALDFMDVLRGGPLVHYVAFAVQNLDGSAFQFLAVGDVDLADLHFRHAVRNCISPTIPGQLPDNRCFVARNLSLSDRVLDLRIVIQFDQIDPGVLPVILSIQFNGVAKILAICLQLNHYFLGTFSACILIVVPDLFNRNFRCLQRVRDTGTAHDLLKARNFLFINCVINQSCAIRSVLRQVLGRETPFTVRAGGYGQCIDSLLAVLDIYSDILGQQVGSIVLQVPDLLAADLRQFRYIGVLDVVTGNDPVEACWYFLIHAVSDLGRAVCAVLRQIPGGECPLIVSAGGYSQRIDRLVSVLDIDCDALGHESFIIVLHVPGLLTADFCCLQRVLDGICECTVCVLCNSGSIIGNFFFSDCITDICSACLLRKLRPGIGPVIAFIQLYSLDLGSVSQQVYGHFRRTISILVIAVLPFLRDLYFCFFCCMGVGQGSDCTLLVSVCQRIARRQIFLCPCIIDQGSVGILRQIGNLCFPTVLLIQNHILAVAQRNCQARRTDTVLVVRIVPDLLHGNFGLFQIVFICQRRDRSFCTVIRNGITCRHILFCPAVGNQLSVIIFRQMIDRGCPVVRSIQCDSINYCCASLQVNGHAVRTLSVVVIRVVPDLPDRRGCLFFCIGDRYLPGAVSAVGICRGAGRCSFYYIIGKTIDRTVRRIQMLRQILPLVLPVVGLAQSLCVNNRILLVADDFRNRLQSVLNRANCCGRCETDIRDTIGRNVSNNTLIKGILNCSRNLSQRIPIIRDIPCSL